MQAACPHAASCGAVQQAVSPGARNFFGKRRGHDNFDVAGHPGQSIMAFRKKRKRASRKPREPREKYSVGDDFLGF
jgi:hypothetical protein